MGPPGGRRITVGGPSSLRGKSRPARSGYPSYELGYIIPRIAWSPVRLRLSAPEPRTLCRGSGLGFRERSRFGPIPGAVHQRGNEIRTKRKWPQRRNVETYDLHRRGTVEHYLRCSHFPLSQLGRPLLRLCALRSTDYGKQQDSLSSPSSGVQGNRSTPSTKFNATDTVR